jgi:hypothetical protein
MSVPLVGSIVSVLRAICPRITTPKSPAPPPLTEEKRQRRGHTIFLGSVGPREMDEISQIQTILASMRSFPPSSPSR